MEDKDFFYFKIFCILFATLVQWFDSLTINTTSLNLWFLYLYYKQITLWLARLYDFYYSLVEKDR